ncbi:unnamed protein product [Protopolystoma xenopodis]|uniref:Uncharacterized protein n=1 Tax=Protopolystoma xenopodis TaxID=117903 RepID=A0A3S5CFL3_9PLAT|nr:unnamed protein product [Protopolystoma xenopodis]
MRNPSSGLIASQSVKMINRSGPSVDLAHLDWGCPRTTRPSSMARRNGVCLLSGWPSGFMSRCTDALRRTSGVYLVADMSSGLSSMLSWNDRNRGM